MKNLGLGIHIPLLDGSAGQAVEAILQAEEMGVEAAWMTHGGVQPDPLTIFAAAAMRTSRIKLGTAIVPSFPRHPIALAQQAKAVAQLAPGRFRLGVGPSHQPLMEPLGIPFRRPLSHLREYVHVLKEALQAGGRLQFAGRFFKVAIDCGSPVDIQVMTSALRPRSFELAGEVADGVITWACPQAYVQDVGLPAVVEGAAKARRSRPKVVMHVLVAVGQDPRSAREAAMRQVAFYPQLPFYRLMFMRAGFPEAASGVMSNSMLDAILIHGDEYEVEQRLRSIAEMEVDEVLCSIVPIHVGKRAPGDRALKLLGELSQRE